MKKSLCAALLFAAMVLCIGAQNAVIRELTGEVELKPAGASSFSPARAGSEVAQDTIVSTGFRSTAIIAAGSSVITVRPLTRLSLSEIQETSGTENMSVNLQSGRVKVDVKPPAGMKANFKVQSPSATASVRGTSFEFDTRSLKVTEGRVSFAGSRGAPMAVSAGSQTHLGDEGKAVDPVQVAEASLQPPPPAGADPGGASTPAAPMAEDGGVDFSFDW